MAADWGNGANAIAVATANIAEIQAKKSVRSTSNIHKEVSDRSA